MAAEPTEDTALQRRRREQQVRSTIAGKLEETGERERLEELLRSKLIECGWRDQLKEYCKEIIRSKGTDKISVDDLIEQVAPRGRATVPDAIKAEMLSRIRTFLQQSM